MFDNGDWGSGGGAVQAPPSSAMESRVLNAVADARRGLAKGDTSSPKELRRLERGEPKAGDERSVNAGVGGATLRGRKKASMSAWASRTSAS